MRPSTLPFVVTAFWLAIFLSSFIYDWVNMLLCAGMLLSFFGLGCWWQKGRSLERVNFLPDLFL
jgi:hypothetical protein